MPEESDKRLRFNNYHESMKVKFVIYADKEFSLEKIQACDKDSTMSFTSKVNKHMACGYFLFTHCSSDQTYKKKSNIISAEVKPLWSI